MTIKVIMILYLEKAGKTMEVKRVNTSRILNNINPYYMKNVFKPKVNSKETLNHIMLQHLKIFRIKIWNRLTPNIKSETSFHKIK